MNAKWLVLALFRRRSGVAFAAIAAPNPSCPPVQRPVLAGGEGRTSGVRVERFPARSRTRFDACLERESGMHRRVPVPTGGLPRQAPERVADLFACKVELKAAKDRCRNRVPARVRGRQQDLHLTDRRSRASGVAGASSGISGGSLLDCPFGVRSGARTSVVPGRADPGGVRHVQGGREGRAAGRPGVAGKAT